MNGHHNFKSLVASVHNLTILLIFFNSILFLLALSGKLHMPKDYLCVISKNMV